MKTNDYEQWNQDTYLEALKGVQTRFSPETKHIFWRSVVKKLFLHLEEAMLHPQWENQC